MRACISTPELLSQHPPEQDLGRSQGRARKLGKLQAPGKQPLSSNTWRCRREARASGPEEDEEEKDLTADEWDGQQEPATASAQHGDVLPGTPLTYPLPTRGTFSLPLPLVSSENSPPVDWRGCVVPPAEEGTVMDFLGPRLPLPTGQMAGGELAAEREKPGGAPSPSGGFYGGKCDGRGGSGDAAHHVTSPPDRSRHANSSSWKLQRKDKPPRNAGWRSSTGSVGAAGAGGAACTRDGSRSPEHRSGGGSTVEFMVAKA